MHIMDPLPRFLAAALAAAVLGCSSGGGTSFDGWGDTQPWDLPEGSEGIPDIPRDDGGGVCSPGEVLCTGDTSYNRCNVDGTGWETDLVCEPGTTCMGGGCYSPCTYAERNRSSIGCLFYAADLDQYDDGTYNFDLSPYAIVVSNIDDEWAANVSVQQKTGAVWTAIDTRTIPPNSLDTFRLSSDAHAEDTSLRPGGAYRIESDYPVVAYQFNPIDTADQMSNDASMLLPVHTLDRWYHAASWHQFNMGGGFPLELKGYIDIVGTQDGTQVTIVPSAATAAGGALPALTAGTPTTTALNDGDLLQIASAADGGDLSGTYIEASAPVAVFGGHECADVPYLCDWCRNAFGSPPGASHRENTCAWCDHLEEQIVPLTTWGKTLMASRVPVRSTGGIVEAAFWRVVASEDGTTVNVTARPGITLRFPAGVSLPAALNKGQVLDFEMAGPPEDPGDSLVEADKPVLLMQYIEGQECTNLDAGGGGDPAMIVMVPVEQYLSEYIFLTPSTYEVDYVLVTRGAGAAITLDGAPLADGSFIPVASGWEVGRFPIADGVHQMTGTSTFGIIAVGYSPYVSYGYPGGMSLEIINPVI